MNVVIGVTGMLHTILESIWQAEEMPKGIFLNLEVFAPFKRYARGKEDKIWEGC